MNKQLCIVKGGVCGGLDKVKSVVCCMGGMRCVLCGWVEWRQ
jgi:hypothetical protein